MKKILFLLILLPLLAFAEEPALTLTVPETVRPYGEHVLTIEAPEAGELTVTVADAYIRHEIARQQVEAGPVEIRWDGLIANGEAPARGTYSLSAHLAAGKNAYHAEAVVRVASLVSVGISLAVLAAYYAGMFWAAFWLTLALAAQSAIYSPAKYGLIKSVVGVERLGQANGIVQALTIVAILSGSLAFSMSSIPQPLSLILISATLFSSSLTDM